MSEVSRNTLRARKEQEMSKVYRDIISPNMIVGEKMNFDSTGLLERILLTRPFKKPVEPKKVVPKQPQPASLRKYQETCVARRKFTIGDEAWIKQGHKAFKVVITGFQKSRYYYTDGVVEGSRKSDYIFHTPEEVVILESSKPGRKYIRLTVCRNGHDDWRIKRTTGTRYCNVCKKERDRTRERTDERRNRRNELARSRRMK